MKSYSFGRVAQYARYHYISQSKNYLSLWFTMFGMPALIAILSRDLNTVSGVAMAIYLFGGIGFAVRTTFSMRERASKIREMTLPVSAEERMTFMFFNLTVVFPLATLVASLLALVVASPFCPAYEIGAEFSGMMNDGFLEWPVYVVVQIITASSLLINLLARRNLFVAYLGAFLGVVTFFAVVGRFIVFQINRWAEEAVFMNIYVPEPMGIALFCSIPVVIYALCYWALRRRQVKW